MGGNRIMAEVPHFSELRNVTGSGRVGSARQATPSYFPRCIAVDASSVFTAPPCPLLPARQRRRSSIGERVSAPSHHAFFPRCSSWLVVRRTTSIDLSRSALDLLLLRPACRLSTCTAAGAGHRFAHSDANTILASRSLFVSHE